MILFTHFAFSQTGRGSWNSGAVSGVQAVTSIGINFSPSNKTAATYQTIRWEHVFPTDILGAEIKSWDWEFNFYIEYAAVPPPGRVLEYIQWEGMLIPHWEIFNQQTLETLILPQFPYPKEFLPILTEMLKDGRIAIEVGIGDGAQKITWKDSKLTIYYALIPNRTVREFPPVDILKNDWYFKKEDVETHPERDINKDGWDDILQKYLFPKHADPLKYKLDDYGNLIDINTGKKLAIRDRITDLYPTYEFELPGGMRVSEFYNTLTPNRDYGPRVLNGKSQFHDGVDLPYNVGTEIKPPYKGKIIYDGPSVPGYDKVVVIKHGTLPDEKIICTLYGHLDTIKVKFGVEVDSGTVIGTSGRCAKGAHLHYSIYVGKPTELLLPPDGKFSFEKKRKCRAVDPLKFNIQEIIELGYIPGDP